MKTILPYYKTDPKKSEDASEGVQQNIQTNPDEINIADGGEFLDDAIRMKDQPLEETSTMENEFEKE